VHAQTQLPPYIGSVLLLSPIVGEFVNDTRGMNFVPQYANRLQARRQIHVGSEDWLSDPASVFALRQQVGIRVPVAPGAGHMLGKEYVGPLLEAWLSR
jgi:hypothetical protein